MNEKRSKTPPAPSLPNSRQRLSPFVLSLSKYERTLQVVSGFFNPFVQSLPNPRQRLFPFVLSLSKYERTLSLSSPYPSTGFLRQAQDGAGRTDWKGALR
ncbi:MAG: hypothetical protein LBD67_01900 [Candidatus Accumulibacter sp.]|nr:hypothetical protein [Accumulibacter sp.]